MPDPTIVFAGSPAFAATILQNLIDSPYRPVAVFTQPDRPTGRGRKLKPNAVKKLALSHDLPIEQPAKLKGPQIRALLAEYQPDFMVVAAYGLILPESILQTPRLACLNVHASLLPKWRGAAPIERAAMAGDEHTGVCIMHMEAGLDTGGVYESVEVPIDYQASIDDLEHNLAEAGSQSLVHVIQQFARAEKKGKNLPEPTAQDHNLATYAEKLTPADRQLDWQNTAAHLHRQIWALASRLPVRAALANTGVQLLAADTIEQTPIQQATAEPGTIVDVTKSGIRVQCATDILQITRLKVEKGKGSVLDPAAAINGYGNLFRPGARFAPHSEHISTGP